MIDLAAVDWVTIAAIPTAALAASALILTHAWRNR